MITNKYGIMMPLSNGAAGFILAKAIKCACGRMAMFAVNRGGKTRCLACDEKYKASEDVI